MRGSLRLLNFENIKGANLIFAKSFQNALKSLHFNTIQPETLLKCQLHCSYFLSILPTI